MLDMAYEYRKEIQRMPESMTIVDKTKKVALLGNAAFLSPVCSRLSVHSRLLTAPLVLWRI